MESSREALGLERLVELVDFVQLVAQMMREITLAHECETRF